MIKSKKIKKCMLVMMIAIFIFNSQVYAAIPDLEDRYSAYRKVVNEIRVDYGIDVEFVMPANEKQVQQLLSKTVDEFYDELAMLAQQQQKEEIKYNQILRQAEKSGVNVSEDQLLTPVLRRLSGSFEKISNMGNMYIGAEYTYYFDTRYNRYLFSRADRIWTKLTTAAILMGYGFIKDSDGYSIYDGGRTLYVWEMGCYVGPGFFVNNTRVSGEHFIG